MRLKKNRKMYTTENKDQLSKITPNYGVVSQASGQGSISYLENIFKLRTKEKE